MEFRSYSENDTASLARELAAKSAPGDIILLQGDLGMGKSVFAREFIRCLTGDADMEVPSPTFTLVQTYDGPKYPIWHFDLYRLEDSEEIYETGWEEALSDGIVLVEWPERLGSLKPRKSATIHFKPVQNEPSTRLIRIENDE